MSFNDSSIPVGSEKISLTAVVMEVSELSYRLLNKVSGTPPETSAGEAKLSPVSSVVDANIQTLKEVRSVLREVDAKLNL